MRPAVLLLLAAFVAVLPSRPVRAQAATATLASTAVIDALPLTGGGMRGLDFGVVTLGGSADTGPGSETNVGTAKWEFGSLRKSVTILLQFTLPNLTRGSTVLPVNWSNAGYGSWCVRRSPATESTCGGVNTATGSFNPGASGVSLTTPAGPGNNDRILTVWVGARLLAVPVSTPPGTYTGTATLLITVL